MVEADDEEDDAYPQAREDPCEGMVEDPAQYGSAQQDDQGRENPPDDPGGEPCLRPVPGIPPGDEPRHEPPDEGPDDREEGEEEHDDGSHDGREPEVLLAHTCH